MKVIGLVVGLLLIMNISSVFSLESSPSKTILTNVPDTIKNFVIDNKLNVLYDPDPLENMVRIVDLNTGEILREVDTGGSPHNVQFDHDSRYAYVYSYYPIYTTLIHGDTLDLFPSLMEDIAVIELNKKLDRFISINSKNELIISKYSDISQKTIIPVSNNNFYALNEKTNMLYITTLLKPTISFIDLNEKKEIKTVSLGHPSETHLNKIVVNPNTNKVYVLDFEANNACSPIVCPDLKGKIHILDGTSGKVIKKLTVNRFPEPIAINVFENLVYFGGEDNKIMIIDDSDSIAGSFSIPASHKLSDVDGLYFDNENKKLYVTDFNTIYVFEQGLSDKISEYVEDVFKKDKPIPEWIRNNAQWWFEGSISDKDFVSGIQYLIQNNVIEIKKTDRIENTESKNIPTWIKNNANWWSQGMISDDDFLKGIQYLIENGIIHV